MLTLRNIRRVMIAIAGGTVLLIGIALIVLPGPAVLVIPAGLAILALEFAWAKRWLEKAREFIDRARRRATGARAEPKNSTAAVSAENGNRDAF